MFDPAPCPNSTPTPPGFPSVASVTALSGATATWYRTVRAVSFLACLILLAGCQPHAPDAGDRLYLSGHRMNRIPAGAFTMGTAFGEGNADERPEHRVNLPEYWMDAEEVTFAQFHAFVVATGYAPKGDWQRFYHAESDTLPVMNVTWEDAAAYCVWVGPQLGSTWTARLPSEAEWEKAARGTVGQRYPWGDSWEDGHCNSAEAPLHELMLDVSGHRGPTPVGSWPGGRSPFGLEDCAGNVWEWTRSRYRPYPYRPSDGREDGTDGADRVLRGGSFGEPRCCMRCAFRHVEPKDDRKFLNEGFRCAFYHQNP